MTPSEKIDQRIAELDDWRGEILAELRKTILSADKEIVETWKWMGSPVWELDGILAVATVLKAKVKLTFSNGVALPDPDGVFNAGLGGGKWRAIDISEGDNIDKRGLKALVRAAIEYNRIARLERTAGRASASRAKAARR
ncbi:MAG TPA: DUF1801 domain-containing protein [Devosia sp.]|nr:DUF1801 domain-containing protein [Devosia sp.]